MPISIPRNIIEYFLLGRTRPDAIERYTQDSGIVSDVWLEFAKDVSQPVRVLVAPTDGVSAVDLGYILNHCIGAYRRRISQYPTPSNYPTARRSPSVSPLESFVAVTIFFDELLHVVLPLTNWWKQKGLSLINYKLENTSVPVRQMLEEAIKAKLGHEEFEPRRRRASPTPPRPDSIPIEWAIVQAAPLAALIGAFIAAQWGRIGFPTLLVRQDDSQTTDFRSWVWENAETIAKAATDELSRYVLSEVVEARPSTGPRVSEERANPDDPLDLIHRVFLNREATLAHTEAISTVKADAATRLFEISCRNITWAVIDSGIAAKHPAFADHYEANRRNVPAAQVRPRVRTIVDFTTIEQIRNFDLIQYDEGSPEREKAIQNVIQVLQNMPGRESKPLSLELATNNLRRIASQLEARLRPDWSLIEPLIQLAPDEGTYLVSSHGTHVAGILGADWREEGLDATKEILRGICPDINLYDLRVIDPVDRTSPESALLAALEYIQFVNTRSMGSGLIVHGVNISLSIPHDVRNYACGGTPVCLACDSLIGTGVVVVAAAGNRGWNEQEIGFGNFVFCSITDPGNAQDVITVGSTHRLRPHSYGVSFFSSRGPTGDGRMKPDLVAPGERINGPVPGAGNDELDGTSMAAPFVSGAAAMLMARNRELIGSARRIKHILCSSATDLGREKYFQGHGLLDVLRALQSV